MKQKPVRGQWQITEEVGADLPFNPGHTVTDMASPPSGTQFVLPGGRDE
jgi:hypothetical protein